jgi:plasmid stability protein
MATITVRNLPQHLVERLKQMARMNGRSMEQEVREILESCVRDRASVLKQIEESWKEQTRPTSADEVDRWLKTFRP